MSRFFFFGVAVLLLATGLAPAAYAQHEHAVKPQRIVSINLCADQILLDLVSRERIKALSHLAADASVSAAFEAARGIPATRGEAEVVLGYDPDLVIAGQFSTPATVELLERIGRRVVRVPLASDLDAVRLLVRQIATVVGEAERGERLIADFNRRLAASATRSPGTGESTTSPSALTYQVNGLASGPGSLMDAVLAVAGFRNHARMLGLGAGGSVPLEALLDNPPDLLVLSGPVNEYRTAVAENLRHPALVALRQTIPSLILPWRTWLCGTLHIAGAVERLVEARRQLLPPHTTPGRSETR